MNNQEEKKYQEIWDAVLGQMKESGLYDDVIYTTYIQPSKLFRISGDVALISVPNNISSSIISGAFSPEKHRPLSMPESYLRLFYSVRFVRNPR